MCIDEIAGKYIGYLVDRIHTTVMATKGDDGYLHTCAVDMMYHDDDGVYFLTARGKDLYRRLTGDGRVSITGIRGEDTMGSVSITLKGDVEEVGPGLLGLLLESNPYMLSIYPTEESRSALTVFRIYRGAGEWFDLSKKPIERVRFSFGGMMPDESGYRITESCDGCGSCLKACPQGCIDTSTIPFRILSGNCLRCGRCREVCPSGSVIGP